MAESDNKIFHANTDYKLVDKTSNSEPDIGEKYLTYWYYKQSTSDQRENLDIEFPFDLQTGIRKSSTICGTYVIKLSPDFTSDINAKFKSSDNDLGYPVREIKPQITNASLESGKTLSGDEINWNYESLPPLYLNPDYTPIFARGNGRCNLPHRGLDNTRYCHFLSSRSSPQTYYNSYWLIDMENLQISSIIQTGLNEYKNGPSYSIEDRQQLIIDLCGCGAPGNSDEKLGGGGGAFVSALLSRSSLASGAQSKCVKFVIAIVNHRSYQPKKPLDFAGIKIILGDPHTAADIPLGTHLFTPVSPESDTFYPVISAGGSSDEHSGKATISTVTSYATKNIALIFGRDGAPGSASGEACRRAAVSSNLVHTSPRRLWWLQNDIISVDTSLNTPDINDDSLLGLGTDDYGCGGAGCRPKFLGKNCLAGTSTQIAGWGAGGAGVSASYSRGGAGFAVIYW